jgi:hypothetical protein
LLGRALAQARLQALLDSMIPRRYSERVRAGQIVADPHDHATVLFVSFPKDDGNDAGMDGCAAMEMFRLLDLVYREFDQLVRAASLCITAVCACV